MHQNNSIDRDPTGGPKPLLAEVVIPNAAFKELLWLSGAKLPPGVTVDPARIDWPVLICLSYEQRMLSVLHGVFLQQLGQQEKHAPYVSFLGKTQKDNAKRNLALGCETLRLLDALEGQGIQTLAFKGCVLAAAAFDNLAARAAGDIDLLVKKSEIGRAAEILRGCGYQPLRDRAPAELRGLLALDCEWEWINARKVVALDLHWEFNGKNSGLFMPIERIWSRQQTMPFCGRTIRCLSREDLILMLCLHATKHHLQVLEWIYTIARVVNRSPDLDWKIILGEAEAVQAGRLLQLALLMADEIYGMALPGDVRRQIHADTKVRELAKRALGWMFSGANYLPEPSALRRYYADTRKGFYAKAEYWLHATVTPTAKDYVANLPPGLDWCYSAVRGVRLLGETIARRLSERSAQPPRQAAQWVPEPEILRAINHWARANEPTATAAPDSSPAS